MYAKLVVSCEIPMFEGVNFTRDVGNVSDYTFVHSDIIYNDYEYNIQLVCDGASTRHMVTDKSVLTNFKHEIP